MKTVFASVAMAALFFFAPISTFAHFSTDTPGELLMKLKPVEDNAFSLHLANLQGNTTYISLENMDGETFFSDRVKDHNGYLVKINMTDAPQGRYILKVLQNGQEYTSIIYHKEEQLLTSQVKTTR